MSVMRREERKGEALKKASALQQKRFKKAELDLDQNPFCQDRQLADQNERICFNKNPRFYQPFECEADLSQYQMKVPVPVNTTSYAANHLSKHTSTETLLRYASSANIATVDPLKTRPKKKMGSSKSQGSIGECRSRPPPTFGHRPSSASRHFDKLAMSIDHRGSSSKKSQSAPKINGGTGMSLDNLKALFSDPAPKNKSMHGSVPAARLSPIKRDGSQLSGLGGDSFFSTSAFPTKGENTLVGGLSSTGAPDKIDGSTFVDPSEFRSYSGGQGRPMISFHDPSITAKPSKSVELESKWDNSVYLPKKIKKALTHQPAHPEESVKQRMARYAKISAGVPLNEDPAFVPEIQRHRAPMYKSPRTKHADEQIAMIFRRERERQEKVEKMEEHHRKLVKKERMRNFKKDLRKKVEAKGGPLGMKKAPHVF